VVDNAANEIQAVWKPWSGLVVDNFDRLGQHAEKHKLVTDDYVH
jgi:hypothetical protein